MGLTRRLKIDLAFGAGLLLVVAVAGVSLLSVRGMRADEGGVAHAEQLLRRIEAVESWVKDAETAQRGFLLTADPAYLGPYRSAPDSLARELAALRELVGDDPAQARRLATLDSLTVRRMSLLDETLALARAARFAEALEVVRTGEGLVLMDSLRATARRMQAEEFARLQERQERAASTSESAILLVLLGSVLAMVIVAGSRQSLVRELQARERAEQALAHEQESYRGLVESASDLIFATDGEGRFTYVNPSGARAMGYRAEELRGMSSLELVRPDHRDRVREIFLEQERTRTPTMYHEVPVLTKDGTEVWLGQNVQLLTSGDQVVGRQAMARDITRQLEMERMKDEFLSVVSHELRTPLTAIRGSLGLLAGGRMGTLEGRGQRMLEIAAHNTDRLVRLINDLLDIEKIESGQAGMEKEEVELARLVVEAVEAMQPLAERAGVTLEAAPVGATLLADPDRILQVLTNLISNAVKFSSEGGRVAVRAAVREGEVVVSVEDTGRGIPADKLEAVFERFQQVDSSDARQKGGTGLGLPTARSIVQQHGGRIWAESRWGEGSTFHFSLPLRLPPAVPGRGPGALVLLCDDDPGVTAYVREVLQREGYRVLTVARGEDAVRTARAHGPAAILLDASLPGLSGAGVVKQLRASADTRRIPVVMVSATEEREAGVDPADVIGWVEKPIDREVLLQTVEWAVNGVEERCDVLLVEDDEDLAGVITEMLRANGLATRAVGDGAEAIELSRRLSYDLLVLDLGLPRVDGFQVVDWLRRHNRHRNVPVLVYTARDLDDSERERLRLGRTEFITKARTPLEQLEARVAALLGPGRTETTRS